MTRLGFRLATWNLRYDVQPDNIPVAKSLAELPDLRVAPPLVPPGERPWSARRIRVAQRLGASHVDLVGACQNRWEFLYWMNVPCIQDFRRHLSGRFVTSRNSSVAILRGCVVFACHDARSRPSRALPIRYSSLSLLDISATSFTELGLQVGVGRGDGKSAGEFNPIFYRR